MAVKRRTIWMDDETWDDLARVVAQEQARANQGLGQKITASLVIKDCLIRGHIGRLRDRDHDRLVGYARQTGARGVPEVDAAIEAGERGTTTPFLRPAMEKAIREFRPVPKPSQRK